jgi:hypothetical protein
MKIALNNTYKIGSFLIINVLFFQQIDMFMLIDYCIIFFLNRHLQINHTVSWTQGLCFQVLNLPLHLSSCGRLLSGFVGLATDVISFGVGICKAKDVTNVSGGFF